MGNLRGGLKSGLMAVLITTMTVVAPVKLGLSQTEWVSFTPPPGGFQIQMPLPPTASQVQDASPVGTVTTHIFAAQAGGATFSVSHSDLPALAVQFMGADGLMGQAKSSLLRNQNVREISYAAATVNGLSGKRLVYEATTNGSKRTGEAFFTLNGTRLYVLDALVPAGSEALAQKFLQSFTLRN